jgi:excisionase family DNA binding protein
MQKEDVPVERMLYGRQEGARILGISQRKYDQLVAEHKIHVRRVGRRVLVTRRELERFANAR